MTRTLGAVYGYIGLGELLQHVPGYEPTVGNLHGREPPGLAELGYCDVLCAKVLSNQAAAIRDGFVRDA